MRTSVDVFAKAREHERVEQLQAARELDLVPYFRVLEGPTLPVVEMEGRERIMLGSNNYLGLTGDERVQQGALEALSRYGTGLTGSRFLNGTTDLHLELEQELAEWFGTAAALAFTTGHQANVGALGTILGPSDTVVADSGDHASILAGCMLSRAKLRPSRHSRTGLLARRAAAAARGTDLRGSRRCATAAAPCTEGWARGDCRGWSRPGSGPEPRSSPQSFLWPAATSGRPRSCGRRCTPAGCRCMSRCLRR